MNKLNICLQLLNYSILDYVRRLYRTADHRNGRTTRLCDVTDKIVLVHLVTVAQKAAHFIRADGPLGMTLFVLLSICFTYFLSKKIK